MIHRYNLGPMDNNTYLIVDEATNEAALVDPSFRQRDPAAHDSGRRVQSALHPEHARTLRSCHGQRVLCPRNRRSHRLHRADLFLLQGLEDQAAMFGFEAMPSPDPALYLEDDQTLMLGETPIRVLFTPGHAPGHVAFLVGEDVIAGDALFKNSIGRTDLPGGSLQTLLHSIRTRLLTLPDATRVLPGHGAATTIGAERSNNPHLKEPS